MNYLNYVNTKMGTDSNIAFSRGNTLPLCQLPFGMCAFAPQTTTEKEHREWFFEPNNDRIDGIRLTHQPSPWIGDYGTFLFAPTGGESYYDREKAIFAPDYINVYFENAGCRFELTPTERGGVFKIELENEDYFVIKSSEGNTNFKLDKENIIIYGTNDHHLKDDAKNFKMYFAISIDSLDIDEAKIGKNEIKIKIKDKKAEGRVGISYISYEMARLTLERECAGKAFDLARKEAQEKWQEALSRISIDSDDEKQLKIFYSCMYRAFLFPHRAYEIDENGQDVHYSPFTGKTHKGKRYTDNGFWDTYRTSYPLFSLIARDELEEMLEGFATDYEEGGYLPRWTSMGEVGCMPSTLIDGVIAEAAVRGVGDKELHRRLLKGMLHHANVLSDKKIYGRNHIDKYLKYGYVPYDFSNESINLSLDFSYGDWCIGVVADLLGEKEIADEYFERSLWYRQLFDKKTGFFRAKNSRGEWREDFDPFVWGYDYTESSAWQNIFGAPHALDDIASMLGGREKAISKIDEILDTPPIFKVGRYGCEIHEMTEMAVQKLGQCAISNQPSFSIPFLYSYYGDMEKSDKVIRKIADECFTPDSYPGDEDNGSMSAWYIFATIGKYPICPGKKEYAETTPLVKGYKINGQNQ
ncbi:MAG: GH92 family glycosyl hydrolase [Clostridia bacterium]|nr:GH92 family glycosyl hydrolase [Clostridia bacterium]